MNCSFKKTAKSWIIQLIISSLFLSQDWIPTGRVSQDHSPLRGTTAFKTSYVRSFQPRPKPIADLRTDYITHNTQTLHFLFQRTDQTHLICQSNHNSMIHTSGPGARVDLLRLVQQLQGFLFASWAQTQLGFLYQPVRLLSVHPKRWHFQQWHLLKPAWNDESARTEAK